MANLYEGDKNYDKALELLRKALDLYTQAEDKIGEASVLFGIGNLFTQKDATEQGNNQALDYFNRALAIDQSGMEAYIRMAIAESQLKQGNLAAARENAVKAVDIVESARKDVANHDAVITYFESLIPFYGTYIDVLMKLDELKPNEGYLGMALEVSEQTKARRLAELLSTGDIGSAHNIAESVSGQMDSADGTTVKRMLKQKRELQQQIRLDMQHRGSSRADDQQPTVPQSAVVADLIAQYRDLEAQIRESLFGDKTDLVRALRVSEIQRKVLDDDTALIEYFLGEHQSYVWVLTEDNLVSATLPGRKTIESAAMNLYGLVYLAGTRTAEGGSGASTVVVSNGQFQREAAQLSSLILNPIAKYLKKKRLVIVGDGALNYVPFAALPLDSNAKASTRDSGPARLLQHQLVSAPSASVLGVLRSKLDDGKLADHSVAVLGDPVYEGSDERISSRLGHLWETQKGVVPA